MKRGDWIAIACAALVVSALAVWPQDAAREARGKRVAEMAETWSGEIAFEAGYDALDPAGTNVATAMAASGFDPTDPYSGLPRNAGYELAAAYCSGCHSMQIVMQQRHDAQTWGRLIDWMTSQGMPAPEARERATLVAYLSRNFGDQAPAP
jgi:hypothetical protein